jgi:hypothetical protein
MLDRKTPIIFFVIFGIILIVGIIWAIYLVPKQMEFINWCNNSCFTIMHLPSNVEFHPAIKLNADCYCVNVTKLIK